MLELIFHYYAYPRPEGFNDWRAQPDEAYYIQGMKGFISPYEVA
jgi:hypothetical protein